MGGSADPEDPAPMPTPTPSPTPSPAKPSPSSSDAKRLRRCVQSRLPFGSGRSGGGGGGAGVAPPAPAAEEAAGKEAAEEPEKAKRKARPRRSAAARKPSSNKETTGLDPGSKDEAILVDESPQKKQRKGRNQDAARKAPNRKRCKVLESPDGHRSCQQLHSNQTEAILPEGSSVSIDIDLNNVPSEATQANDNNVLDNEDKSQVIVDLRSEAKIAAQEIRMLSSGKKLHPFFASRKVNKGAEQDAFNNEDTNSLGAIERDPPFWPVHVVYQLETDIPIHWSKWLIAERSFLDTSASDTLENPVSFFEDIVKPLTIESNSKKMCLDQLAEQNVANHTAFGMDFPSFPKEQCEGNLSSLDVIHLDEESCPHDSLSYNKHPERILQGRAEVDQKGCLPDYYLWTDKYRPETAAQVCGNIEHVKFLSEWLKGWDERGHKNKQTGVANESINASSCQDESDTDCSEDASDYENVLLITGPVGCGKSAAVFACAREHGFNVIEVNTSDMRNGAYVKQKFEEATKSHGLEKWSQEEVTTPPRIDSLDPASETPDRTEYKCSVSCSTRKTCNDDEHMLPVKCYSSSKLSDEAPKQVINKTLILFEDVDTVFDEDRGFISTILKIAETTRWPIILTSNKKDPALPHLLDQLVLDFKYPSSGELLSHLGMICKSEGVEVTAPQLKYFINACLGDIRRTTLLLQFWYQGKQEYTERSNKCLSGPFSLDLDAVHSTVPRMLPWDFPCKLSETVCLEIEKTIHLAEEKKRQMELSEFEALELQITAPLSKGRGAVKTTKIKKSKLKHGHSTECNAISPCKNDLDDFDDAPETSLPSDQQKTRKKHGVVLLSESDDDQTDAYIAKDARFTLPEGDLFPQPPELPHIHGQGISNQFCFPSESRETFEIANSFQNQFESNLVGSISQICDTFMSQGVSCVPESSLALGGVSASVSSDDLLSSMVFNGLSTFNNDGVCTKPITSLEDSNHSRNLMAGSQKCMEDVVGETCEVYAESFGRNEPESCSTTGYQLMDECSRADSTWLLSGKKTNDCCKVEHVQDTWNRLRRCCPVLPSETNHNRTASGALKLASGVSDLISESDLMVARCHPLTNDILDPSSTPSAEPDDLSWYDKQLEMGSVYAQHALCVFSRDLQDKEDGFIDLSQELLFASTTVTSLGKLISSGISSDDGYGNISHMKNPTSCISKGREQLVHLCGALLPVVPSKLSLSLRGPAFVDYLSSTCQISQLENLRLTDSKAANKQRRCRQSRHYLSSAALSMSPEDIELLAQSNCFGDRREKVIDQAIA
ncbi:ATPase family AAA domain-containing protein 5 [Hordeum vulgare]|uniref:AAA+ ATPase domain-containing protein n=1 Tax=Hordeum vulgare subsp. vulgare TaxID=112509 RepID=A0A8I6XLN6_HORVV|nr:uncharacterized protein LOC123449093 isoform X2 [Hordeum vulgare subsp. vulgare]KAE8793741.1 ATPase family AAA domain-containing protein 5 [Hordeum vulgare]